MAKLRRRSTTPALAWLVNTTALENARSVDDLKWQIAQLTDAGVPMPQILKAFDLADWYRRRLTE